ncbi:heterodisulfide reductase-related iron-sulfur binding cluster [Thermodesulfobacteriota bacterium]
MATRYGLQTWYPDFFDRFGSLTVFDLLADYLKSGRIRLDKTKITQRVAYHDPCNYGRKSEELFGHGFFEEPRWVLDQCVSDWVDLYPSKAGQYCCGGGGGTLLTPFKEERLHYGRRKIEQIKHAEAEMIVLPCHSCHGQIRALLAENNLAHIRVKYLWEVVADSLVLA